MAVQDPLLTGLSCAMALGCFVSHSLHTIAGLACLIALLWRMHEDPARKLVGLRGLNGPIMLYVVAFVVSALAGVDQNSSFGYVTELKRPALAYLLANCLCTRREIQLVAGTAVAAACLSSVLTYKQWYFGGRFEIHHLSAVYAPFELRNPPGLSATHNDLAMLLMQALPYAAIPVLFFARSLKGKQIAGGAAVAFMITAGLLRTLSRASTLGALVGLAVAGLALRPKRVLPIFLALALVYPLLPHGLVFRHGNPLDLSDYSNWFRVRMLQVSLQMAQQYLPLGIGRHNFSKVHERMKSPDEEISPHAHNNYLQLLVEMGYPGIIAYVWFQLAALFGLVRAVVSPRYGPDERMLLGAVLMGFAGFLVDGFFHYDWSDALPAAFMWMNLGIAWAIIEQMPLDAQKSAAGEVAS